MSYLLKYNAFLLVYCPKKLNYFYVFLLAATTKWNYYFLKHVVNCFGSYSEIKECALWITSFQNIVLHQEINGSQHFEATQCPRSEGSIGPRNVSIQLLVDAVSYPRRMETSATILQKPQIPPVCPQMWLVKEVKFKMLII